MADKYGVARNQQVLTNYAGKFIRHDSSQHLWAPAAREKWYLITSLDNLTVSFFMQQLLKKKLTIQFLMRPLNNTGNPLSEISKSVDDGGNVPFQKLRNQASLQIVQRHILSKTQQNGRSLT
jgi:hypothetical protein